MAIPSKPTITHCQRRANDVTTVDMTVTIPDSYHNVIAIWWGSIIYSDFAIINYTGNTWTGTVTIAPFGVDVYAVASNAEGDSDPSDTVALAESHEEGGIIIDSAELTDDGVTFRWTKHQRESILGFNYIARIRDLTAGTSTRELILTEYFQYQSPEDQTREYTLPIYPLPVNNPDHSYRIALGYYIGYDDSYLLDNQLVDFDPTAQEFPVISNLLATMRGEDVSLSWNVTQPSNMNVFVRKDNGQWNYIKIVQSGSTETIVTMLDMNPWFRSFNGQNITVQFMISIVGQSNISAESGQLVIAFPAIPHGTPLMNSFTGFYNNVVIPIVELYALYHTVQFYISIDGSSPTIILVESLIEPYTWHTFRLGRYIQYVPSNFLDGSFHHIQITAEEVNAVGDTYAREPVEIDLRIPIRSEMMVTAPENVIVDVKRVKDALTNQLTGIEFSAVGDFDPSMLKVEASIDGAAYGAKTFDVLSMFPPAVKIKNITIPQDGLTHFVNFKLLHQDTNTLENSEIVEFGPVTVVFDLAPPAAPTNVTATRLRDGSGRIPDQVQVAWTSTDPVEIIVLDAEGKKRTVYRAVASESSAVIENIRRYAPTDGQARNYRFGVQAVNRSGASPVMFAPATVSITSLPPDSEQSPDEQAGTAQRFTQAQLISALATQLSMDQAQVNTVLQAALTKVKDVVAKGGSVALADFGIFQAKWTTAKTQYRNGQFINVPPKRTGLFDLSKGFETGVRLGRVMSDTEAAMS